MSNRAPLDEVVRGASATPTQALDELRCAETIPQRSTQQETLPPDVVDRIVVDVATEFGADPIAETIPAFGSRYVVAVTIPREATQPIDWTSLPCAGESLLEAGDTLSDDLEVAAQISLDPFEDEVVGARFRLVEQVHRSVMGWVWRAVDQATTAAVAVKLVPPLLAPALDAQELAALAAVSAHPGLVTLIEHGRHRAWWYQVSIWINGRTLQSVLEDPSGIQELVANVGPWMRQLAAALQAHHRAGFVHGDVKASNVMVTGRRACLVDLVGLRIGASWRAHGGLTEIFASPQARAGEPADPRDDVYGLASMAARILDCKSATEGDGRLRDRLNPFQTEALRKALDPDRERRTESVTAFVNAVWPAPARSPTKRFTALGGTVSAGTSRARSARRRRVDAKRLAGAAAALAAVIVSVATWQLPVSIDAQPSFAVENGIEPGTPAWAPAVEQRSIDREPAAQRTASTLVLAGLPSLNRDATGAAAPAFFRVRNDYVVDPAAALSLGSASGPRAVAVNAGRQAPRPEALSLVTEAVVWISASDPPQNDEKKKAGASREFKSDAHRSNVERSANEDHPTEARSTAVESKPSSAASRSSTETLAHAEPSAELDSTVPAAMPAESGATTAPSVKSPSVASTALQNSEPAKVKAHGKPELAAAVVSELPAVADLPTKAKGKPEVLAAAVVAALPAVPDLPEVPKVKGKPEVPVAAVVAALPAVPDLPEVPKVHGKPEVPVAAVVAALPAVPDLPEVPKVHGKPEVPVAAVVAALPAVPSVPVIPKVGKPDLPAAAVVAALPAVPNVPMIPKVHGKPDLPVAAVVAALPIIPNLPAIPKIHGRPGG